MSWWLVIGGAMIVCFADREAGCITFQSGTKIAYRYPLLGIIMIIAGSLV